MFYLLFSIFNPFLSQGVVAFSSQGDRIALTQIEQMVDGQYHKLGYYDTQADNLTWFNNEQWVGGKVDNWDKSLKFSFHSLIPETRKLFHQHDLCCQPHRAQKKVSSLFSLTGSSGSHNSTTSTSNCLVATFHLYEYNFQLRNSSRDIFNHFQYMESTQTVRDHYIDI